MEHALGPGVPSYSDNQQEGSSTRKRPYHRHTPNQIQRLESFFKECPHPNESQRRQLARELGLDPRQIKFWFQNKRTQNKTHIERASYSSLRAENERIKCENRAIKQALQKVICKSCDGIPSSIEDRGLVIQQLKLENAKLKDEHDKLATFLEKCCGKSISELESNAATLGNSSNMPLGSLKGTEGEDSAINPNIHHIDPNSTAPSPFQFSTNLEMENARMIDIAATATDELIRLLQINEPLWIKSPINQKYVLDYGSYEKMFARVNHFRTSTAHVESSKYSGIVSISSTQLVDIFLDADKWAALFPTIITQARAIQILRPGKPRSHDGFLQLMYQQMHTLSPLIPPRESYFLRHCKQIGLGIWVIADTSYNILMEPISPFISWRLPSGCIIQEMPHGCSKVTWVEHVEVDDKSQTHSPYRNLVSGSIAYGAQRWVLTLQRMCERLNFFLQENAQVRKQEVINLAHGKRNLMQLAHSMIKKFCSTLSMIASSNVPQPYINNSGVRIHYRANGAGLPNGVVISGAASLWLPWLHDTIFDVLKDATRRDQSINPGSNTMILQETSIDALGSYVIYASMEMAVLNLETTSDQSLVPILPSGFIISPDSRHGSCGSLLTVALQVLASSPSASSQPEPETLDVIKRFITTTVENVKVALKNNTFA